MQGTFQLCKYCRFFDDLEMTRELGNVGICRRYPPQHKYKIDDEEYWESPEVLADSDWCGEWRPIREGILPYATAHPAEGKGYD